MRLRQTSLRKGFSPGREAYHARMFPNAPTEVVGLPGERRRRGSSFYSMLGLLFLTAVVPLVLTSWYLANQAGVALELDQRSLQMAKVRHVSEWIAQSRSSTRALFQTLATSLAIDAPADYKKRIDSLAAKRTLEAFPGASSSLVAVNVVDRNGFGARSGLAMPEPAVAAGIQAAYLAGLKGESTSTAPLWSTTLSEPVVIYGEPVLAPNGKAQAVLIATATLEPVVRLIRESGQGGILDVLVVTSDGKLVAHSDPKFASTGADMKENDLVQEFVQPGGGAAASVPFTLKDSTGVTRQMLGTFIRVADDSGWGVIAQIPEAKAYAGADSMRRNSILVVSVVSLLALGLGLLLSRWIT